MNHAPADSMVEPAQLEGRKVVVSGPRDFKNALMCFFLEREGGARCDFEPEVEEALVHLPSYDILLWDVHKVTPGQITQVLSPQTPLERPVALFDVSPDQRVEREAIKMGVKGFFYTGEPLHSFLKGVRAISEGELWVPRKVMERCLIEADQEATKPTAKNGVLTNREVEVLRRLLEGARNDDIAEVLCISPNTVKTHIYKIFKKINVSNRLQAARWASENLNLNN